MTKLFDKVPLKTILLNFVNHVQTLDCKLSEGEDLYEKEFLELKLISESQKSQPAFSCSEGERDVNRRKNRYKDILPFDYTRVTLSPLPGIPGSDYINANFVKGASGSPAYIASQGPLPHTVTDFWRMVVECEVQVVIMACNETESGKHKCECYWPEEIGTERSFGPYTIRMLDSRQIGTDFCLRKLELVYPDAKGSRVTRTIAQFHYWAWPDHGVPTQVRPLLEMVRWVRDCQASETLPLLVHCSAGCGRTGTICALDYVWGLLRAGKLSPDFSLFELVREMRRQRIAMVQTKEQYTLVHRAVRDLFLDQLKVIDSHPYENLDMNGRPRAGEKEETDYENVYVNLDRSPLGTPESQATNPPPLPDRKRESASPIGKPYLEVIRDTPRHSRNNSLDTHTKSITSTPVSQTPGSSYEELSAIVSKTAKFPVERTQTVTIPNRILVGNESERNFVRLNFTSTSPEPKHSRTKPSDVKAKSKGGKVSSVIKRSKSLKVPSTASDVKVRPTSPILERRYLVPSVTEVVPERSFVRPNRVHVGDSRFYIDLTKDGKSLERRQKNAEVIESRDCERETISVRPPQMLRFPKQQSAPTLEPSKYQKFASVSPTLLRKPVEEKVSIAKKQMSLSPVFVRKHLEVSQATDLVTASLDRYRDVRKSQNNLNIGGSHFAGLVGSIDRSGDPIKIKNSPVKPQTEVPPTICHLNASTTQSFPTPRSDSSRDTSCDSARVPLTIVNICDSSSKKCDFSDNAQTESPVPVVLHLKCESGSNTGDYDNVEKCARKDVSGGKDANQKHLQRYEKVWLTSNSEPVYANLPLKKSVSMKEIKLQPELCLSDKEYFIKKSDEIAKLLKDLKCVTEPVEDDVKNHGLKPPDGPVRSKSEDYISSPPFREPPSYEAVISSQLYKEKLSRIADLAESKERQQRRMARRENGPVAPPRTKRNGSFNDHTPKWSDSSKESSPQSSTRRGEESRLASPNSFPPPVPNRTGSFVGASSPKSGKGSSSASSPAGSPKSKPPMAFLKPDPPMRANAAAQAANRAFQKALSRFQATATQLKSKLINMKDPLSPVNGEDNIACSDQGHIYEDVVPPPDTVPVLRHTKKQEYL